MHKEYAIDPYILVSFDRIRALLGTCGWHKGKVVCEYPKKKWKRIVYDTCRVSGDKEKKALEEFLNAQDFVQKKNAQQYDAADAWLVSAKVEHTRKVFTAIVSNTTDASSCVIDGSIVTEDNESLWARPSGVSPRSVDEYVEVVSLLVQNSSVIKFIDPYFDSGASRFTRPFSMILKLLSIDHYKVATNRTVELHINIGESPNVQGRQSLMEQQLPPHIPSYISVKVYLWKELNNNGERFHNRYLLTELGGLSWGIGLDIDDTTHEGTSQTDDIHILTNAQFVKRNSQYDKESDSFELLADFTIKGNGS